MSVTTVTVYERRGCHLCEDMISVLNEFAEELVIRVSTVDIDRDPAVSAELRQHYNALVPVLCVNGHEICHHFLDLEALRAALIQQRQDTVGP